MPSGPPEFIPPFIPVTGMKCSYGEISSPLTRLPRSRLEKPRSREPSQPALSYEHIESFTKAGAYRLLTDWTPDKGFRGKARFRKAGQPGLFHSDSLKLIETECEKLEKHTSSREVKLLNL